MSKRIRALRADAWDFYPAILQAQHVPPSPLPRLVLYTLMILFGVLLVWATFGRLDIVAVAQGKLVPQTFLKVVQPAEAGVVKDILVKEGDAVNAGQVLMRMDTSVSTADRKVLDKDFQLKALQLRRIDAELKGVAIARRTTDDAALFAQVESQHRAHRQAYQDAIDSERAALAKPQSDLRSAIEIESKLKQTLPIFREQEKGWDQLAKEGFAGKLMALAVTTAQRVPALPNVPTMVESGYPQFVSSSWQGIFVPAGTPDRIVRKLYSSFAQVLKEPEIRFRFDESSTRVAISESPEEFARFIGAETVRWGELVKRSGATSD